MPDDNYPVMPNGTAFFEKPITDEWIHVELNTPQGELLWKSKVVGRSKDGNGEMTVSFDPKPSLNILTYDVDLSYGEIK